MNFPELTAYQPLISGNTGNRASLHSARIGSYLHTYRGPNRSKIRFNPWTYYTSSDQESQIARYLLITAIPFQAFFVITSYFVAKFAMKPLHLNAIFFIGYLFTVSIQVSVLLYLAQIFVYGLFHYGFDPDMHAIPLLTSVGDLLGTSLLLALFYVMSYGELVTKSIASSNNSINQTTACLYE
ncbi:divalent cation transporter [Dictyocaulus viviparus]|uniref:Divalent cation transporter n=1 Tax=Dictyocaulus viviparus TaxID=29172 RepID=A0A0D8XZX7_DICVI|nr:divalent cation transporter [Dictyocaulus viviparus]